MTFFLVISSVIDHFKAQLNQFTETPYLCHLPMTSFLVVSSVIYHFKAQFRETPYLCHWPYF
jgi:hypothetical protein